LRALALLAAGTVAAGLLVLGTSEEPAQAAFPGHNGNIAYAEYDVYDGGDDDFHIFTVNVESGTSTKVAGTQAGSTNPAYSPDGKTIAYRNDYDHKIYAIPAEGGTPTPLLPETSPWEAQPAWAPDGQTIAYVGDGGIHTVPISGGSPTKVAGAQGYEPNYSPDGKTIAYSGWDGEIHSIPASGGTPTKLTAHTDDTTNIAANPNYSPDGKKIAYTVYDPYTTSFDDGDIYAIPATGGTPTNLTKDLNNWWETYKQPAWSPDGSKIVVETPLDSLYIIPASGGTPTSIQWIGSMFYPEAPDWGVSLTQIGPKSKAECKKGGYKDFGFKNQAKCIRFVKENG
jgi:Tol biopolymer transport system component